MDSVKSIPAGSTLAYSIEGTATHGGGSCQISMSYDSGASWNVIHSIIGGCMVEGLDLSVEIPSEAPSGEALFSWSWFNHLGNREMYQNCAVVTITNGGSGLTGPTPFVANVGVNECHTIEGIDVVFPNPGSSVSYGGSYASSKPTAVAGFTGTNCIGPGATSSPSNTTAIASDSSSSTATNVTPISAAASVAASTAIAGPATSAAVVAHAVVDGTTSTSVAGTTTTATAKTQCQRRRRRSHSRDLSY